MPCQRFSLAQQTYWAYCTEAYDGDTCTLNVRTSVGDHEWKVRLEGLDAPERKTDDPLEKQHALACRQMLLDLIGHKYVVVACGAFEKYGRLLATVWVRRGASDRRTMRTESCSEADVITFRPTAASDALWINVNRWLLDHTPCVPYTGKTKVPISYNGLYHPHYCACLAAVPLERS